MTRRAETPLLDVDSLSTVYRSSSGAVHALADISFHLQRGQTLGVVGESGSGKSTLLRSVMGLLPAAAQRSGSVRLDGTELVSMSRREVAKLWGPKVGMVFQDPMTSLNPVVRIGRQLTEVLRLHLAMNRADARQRALELLELVGVPDPELRLGQYAHQLSGGLRQRVVIAMAVACNPELLLADEPTSALDATVAAQILDLLLELQQRLGMAMILVTHNMGVAAQRTDDIAVMYAGRIVEYAATRDLFAHTKMPYTEALLESIPSLGGVPRSRLNVIAGSPPSLTELPPGCSFAPRCPYAGDICVETRPALRTFGLPAHAYACWKPLGGDEAGESTERTPGDDRTFTH